MINTTAIRQGWRHALIQINTDRVRGVLPSDVDSFDELHNFLDANSYGADAPDLADMSGETYNAHLTVIQDLVARVLRGPTCIGLHDRYGVVVYRKINRSLQSAEWVVAERLDTAPTDKGARGAALGHAAQWGVPVRLHVVHGQACAPCSVEDFGTDRTY